MTEIDVLCEMLRDPNPAVRDEQAYSELSSAVPELAEAACRALGYKLVGRLTDPELHVRSFAALVLADIVNRGVYEPLWFKRFEAWFTREDDLRGWDPELGWLHAVAHGSDLLGAFALCKQVTPAHALDIATRRILRPTTHVFDQLEHARLAHAAALALSREAVSLEDSVAWLDRLAADLEADESEHITPVHANMLGVLQALHLIADRGAHRGWSGGEVFEVVHKSEVKRRAASILRVVMPYCA